MTSPDHKRPRLELPSFALERYFARYEFKARYLLSSSDCQALMMRDLVDGMEPELRQRWDGLSLGYTESRGDPQLLSEICRSHYTTVDTDHLLAVVPEEGIYLSMQGMIRPGDHVVVCSPGYQSLVDVAIAAGATVDLWEPDLLNGRFHFDPKRLESLLKPATRSVVINFPHNPTGAVPTPDELMRIVTLCTERGAYLFSDEMYRGLEHEGDRLPSVADLYEKGVVLGGMSKAFALPGLRVGWVATRCDPVLAHISALKDFTTICGSAPSELLAIAGLHRKEEILSRNKALIARGLRAVRDLCAKHPGTFSFVEPRGGSTAFVECKAEGGDAESFCDHLVERTGIMLVPGGKFRSGGTPPEDSALAYERFVRFGLGRENCEDVCKILSEHLSKERET